MNKFSSDSILTAAQETIIFGDSVAYDYGTNTVYYANEKYHTDLLDIFWYHEKEQKQ